MLRFERLTALVRLDHIRESRARKQRVKRFSDATFALEQQAAIELAALANDGLFEPLNRAERRMYEKLARRGRLIDWYTRRLMQVGQNALIPYLRDWLAAPPKTRAA